MFNSTPVPQILGLSSAPKAEIKKIADAVALWDRQIARDTKAGKPLSQRVIEHTGCAFLFEFADGDEDVYGCYDMAKLGPLDPLPTQPDYWLTVEGEMVTRCNCKDMECRKRLCVHAVWLAILGGFSVHVPSLPLPAGIVVPASRLHGLGTQGPTGYSPVMQGRVS